MVRHLAALLCAAAALLAPLTPPFAAAAPAHAAVLDAAVPDAAVPDTGGPRPGGGPPLPIRGADVSSLAKSEALGGTYRYANGRRGDALAILRHDGLNYIRLKVWVNPADGYNDRSRVLAVAKRAKALGMSLLVDFHYSDSWADPGKQNKPAAWESLSFDELQQALYDHTYDVLGALKAQGTTADMVQVGNELNGGLLWPDGRWDNWPQLAALLNAGYDAVKAVSGRTKVVLHLADGGDNGLYRWWFDNAAANGIRYDVIGLSYYPYWHGTMAAFQANLNDVAARYGKPVVVAETAYPFTTGDDDGWANTVTSAEPYPGYPATPAGQAAFARDLMNIVRAVPGGRGLGAFWWEATWTGVKGNGWDPADPASGNAWENQALFGFDDRALPALREFARR
ncbi:glycoside hydrolase family 53 protein [Microbispora bryophytorum]|uniref:Arabinogalactan endo-beta-1,4-galactanase n=1 Tax=Microbispora bryophytorum TaxID=1460882 RepID=A0A8H9H430_9ACTN|nr:arabinogalactan endo-1,4-beta-galactosidase [Microbispora bryophytorum]MBD3138230.1 glycosyl hydrolase 53 family protein [Microbispora bryophytorum]TQS03986.1 arabinogalactan endo-1,4-beta-galactosidase [Microbispora bryophytorum]GGO25446.1 arabinogalactan endo-beta-1,4-galactanase [Microbispora bryophytorum]